MGGMRIALKLCSGIQVHLPEKIYGTDGAGADVTSADDTNDTRDEDV